MQHNHSTFNILATPSLAYEAAILAGRLSLDPSSDRWEGHWYYCGQVNGKAQFRSLHDGGLCTTKPVCTKSQAAAQKPL